MTAPAFSVPAFSAHAPSLHGWLRLHDSVKGSYAALNDGIALQSSLLAEPALRQALTLFHQFEPQGISLVALAARTRVYLHTWPELGLATLDVVAIERSHAERVLASLAAFIRSTS